MTLVRLRHGVTHDARARWFGVDRSTVTHPAVGEIRQGIKSSGRLGRVEGQNDSA
ncbi:transposase family protein [Streptomyces sp. NPDC021020]|uniref:transposase family protein n=1 Tax=Streptomyces sp. NPDC021020 TaxID=3365109 RepID=UPI0037B22076